MRLVFVLLVLSSFSLLSQTNIVGGEDAEIQNYPYQAALLYTSGSWTYAYCGASIINEYWILTAAHCVEGESASNTIVRVGSDNFYAQGGVSYTVEDIIIHDDYNTNTMNNDIALIKLEDPISFNNSTQLVSLICDDQVNLGVQDPGEMSWVSGWGDTEGTTTSSQLQVVGVPITTDSNYGWGQIDTDMIMAGYQDGGYDSCQGDSGGPMVVLATDEETYLQSGIVSWGSGCADATYPGVYTRVSYFIDWICNNTDGIVCTNESGFCSENSIYGCPDITAVNYDSNVTVDDGSCEYSCDQTALLTLTFDCWPEEIGWSIMNNNIVVASQNTGYYSDSFISESICLSTGCYVFTITDSYGDGLGGSQWSSCDIDGNYQISVNSEILINGEGDFGFSNNNEFCISNIIYGCTDDTACNYNFLATEDNGLCVYPDNNFDCNGNCIVDIDCNGECGGDTLDLGCGCGNPEPLEGYDCNGNLIFSTQYIPLEVGWNIWSTYINTTADISTIFSDINTNVIIVKDQNGDVYWPEYALNSIGNLSIGEGYQTKMNSTTELMVEGDIISNDYEIDVEQGWGIIGYLNSAPNDITEVFESYNESLVIIKDEDGNVYWPEYDLNSIINMSPGEGYQIKTSNSFSFSSINFKTERISSNDLSNNKYFESPNITGNNMTILFPSHYFNQNNEIAAFDSEGSLIGSSIVTANYTVLTVWGDDLTTDIKDGISIGETIKFKMWDYYTNSESIFEIISWKHGGHIYNVDGISIVDRISLLSSPNKELIGTYDLIGRSVPKHNFKGIVLEFYNDGSYLKRFVK